MGRGDFVRAGEFRRRLLIQHVTKVKDSFGQLKETWTDFCRVWAKVEPLSGQRLMEAKQVNNDITHRVTLRFREDIDEEMRFNMKTRVLNIATHPTQTEERREFITMLCIERPLI